ncbi:MAG: 6-carboxytetrahydropterin synthase [Bryobacteraceae bacterium]|nr:6-carboxytetrahydropterin synthase [Bryobacteraceae bacterium]
MIRLTRRYRFSASHRLHAPTLAEGENAALYGKCNNPYGHGHDYVLEVSVRGPVDQRTGLSAPVAALDEYVSRRVLRDFSQRNLNLDLPEFAGDLVPTSENVALVIENRLRASWPQAWPDLEKVRIRETPRNIFDVVTKQPNEEQ